MEDWVFRLEITGNFTDNKDNYEVLTLPADEGLRDHSGHATGSPPIFTKRSEVNIGGDPKNSFFLRHIRHTLNWSVLQIILSKE